MTERFTESVVEDAALDWLAELGWAVKHGPDISPDGDTLTRPSASLSLWERERGRGGKAWERESYNDVVLLERFRNALLPKLMSGEIRTTQLRTT